MRTEPNTYDVGQTVYTNVGRGKDIEGEVVDFDEGIYEIRLATSKKVVFRHSSKLRAVPLS